MAKVTYRKGSVSWLSVQGNRSFMVGQARQKGLEAPDSMTAQSGSSDACMHALPLLAPFPHLHSPGFPWRELVPPTVGKASQPR